MGSGRSTRRGIRLGLGVVALSTIIVFAAADRLSTRSAVTLLAAGVVTTALGWVVPSIPERIEDGLGRAIQAALFGALGLVAVLLPWVWRRTIGAHDPAARWVVRGAPPVAPSARWTAETSPTRADSRRVAATAVLVAIAAGVSAGGLVGMPAGSGARPAPYRLDRSAAESGDRTSIPAAFADSSWYPTYRADIEASIGLDGVVPLIDGQQLADGRSEYINVVGGRRSTWVPPRCSCRRIVVWMYGASTTFGIGQRDGHTIPSELARVAWSRGVALDVVNKGVPSEQHWQEVNRLRWDLTREPPPDLIVFYDGASEMAAATWMEERHLADSVAPVQQLTEDFLESPAIRGATDESRARSATPTSMAGVSVTPSPTVPPRSPDGVGALAAATYSRALAMGDAIAFRAGLDVRRYWQPMRVSAGSAPGEPTADSDSAVRTAIDGARRRLPAGVVDLSDVFARRRHAIFSDDVHHNEHGARLVAESIFADLWANVIVVKAAAR